MKNKRWFIVTVSVLGEDGFSMNVNLKYGNEDYYPRYKDIGNLVMENIEDVEMVTVLSIQEVTKEDWSRFWDGMDEYKEEKPPKIDKPTPPKPPDPPKDDINDFL